MISEEQEPQKTHWLKESVTVKLACIAALILLLLIPSAWVNNLIIERSARQDEMRADVSSKWSGSQLVQGPVLIIPYTRTVKEIISGKEEYKVVTENLYIMPDTLNVIADARSEILHRVFSMQWFITAGLASRVIL